MKKALVVVVVFALLGGSMAVAAQGGYSVSVSGSTTDIPTITVSFGGNSHSVSEVAVRDPGGSVTADATGPENTTYDVNLYNSDGDVVQSSRKGGGSTTTDFDLDCCSPGTYGIAIYDSEVKDLAGVVVAGYDVSLDAPDSGEQNSTVTATVELDETGGGAIQEVQVVLSGNGEDVRTTAQKQSGSTYEATIPLEDMPTGSYDAYGLVLSPEEFENGQNEIIGLSSGQSFTVNEESNGSDGTGGTAGPTPAPTPTDPGGPTDTDDTPTDGDGNSGATPTDGDTPTDGNGTDTPDDGTDAPDDEPTDSTDSSDTDDSDDSSDSDGSDDSDEVADTETAADGSGFGVAVAVVALLAALAAFRRE